MTEPVKMMITPELAEQFSEAFHTGLRKGVDSKYSVLAWNAIHLAPVGRYGQFCEYACAAMKAMGEITPRDFEKILREWGELNPESPAGRLIKGNTRAQAHIFDCAMNCMPYDDILALHEWLRFCTEGLSET